MGKIHSGTRAPVNRNTHQQPETVKENKNLKVEKENTSSKAHSTNASSQRNINPSEAAAVKRGMDGRSLKAQLEARLDAFIAAKPKKSEVHVTYVPHNKRHQSKYDGMPPFSRPPGSPDRYRAINPKTGGFLFPIKEKSVLMDGNGVKRGAINEHNLKLNFGQVKTIDKEKCYYTVGIHITDEKGEKFSASGWIKESAIIKGNEPDFTDKQVEGTLPPDLFKEFPKLKKKDFRQYEVRNVKPQDLRGEDGKPKYGYMKGTEFVSYKVKPAISEDENNIAASDYLRRKGNVINLGFNAAGVSTDTFEINRELIFHRAPNSIKGTTIEIDLFRAEDKNHAGLKPVARMRFVYGYVEAKGDRRKNGEIPIIKRWGWMALGALKPKN